MIQYNYDIVRIPYCNSVIGDWEMMIGSSWRLTFPKLPSGKRLHNYGKSPYLMGKSTINGHFK